MRLLGGEKGQARSMLLGGRRGDRGGEGCKRLVVLRDREQQGRSRKFSSQPFVSSGGDLVPAAIHVGALGRPTVDKSSLHQLISIHGPSECKDHLTSSFYVLNFFMLFLFVVSSAIAEETFSITSQTSPMLHRRHRGMLSYWQCGKPRPARQTCDDAGCGRRLCLPHKRRCVR